MNTSYVLYYVHPETPGRQVVWDGYTSTGLPKLYRSVRDCFNDFVGHEVAWGPSLYKYPPQIREVTWSDDPNQLTETGPVWAIEIGELSYVARKYGTSRMEDDEAYFIIEHGGSEELAAKYREYLHAANSITGPGSYPQDLYNAIESLPDNLNYCTFVERLQEILG